MCVHLSWYPGYLFCERKHCAIVRNFIGRYVETRYFSNLIKRIWNVCSSLWSILVFESTREMKRCQRKNVTFLNTWQSYCFGSMLSNVPWSDQLDCLVLVECFAEVMLMTSSFWAYQNFNVMAVLVAYQKLNVMAVLVAIVPRTGNFAASSNSSRCTRQPPLVSSLWPAVPIASMSDSESKATNVMGTRAKRFDVKVNETEKSRFSAKASIWSLGTQQELWWGPSYSPHHSCWSDQFNGDQPYIPTLVSRVGMTETKLEP